MIFSYKLTNAFTNEHAQRLEKYTRQTIIKCVDDHFIRLQYFFHSVGHENLCHGKIDTCIARS